MSSIVTCCRGSLLALLLMCAATSRADYPDYTPQAPPAETERGDRQAAYLEDEDLSRPADVRQAPREQTPREQTPPRELAPRTLVPRDQAPRELVPHDSAPRQLPSPVSVPDRYQQDAPAASPAGLASDVEPAQQILGRGEPIPLAPQSAQGTPALGSDLPPLVTGAASLGIVLGLFLLVVWVVRRGMPKSAAVLPREAFEMLGRAPLIGRQQAHLVRCGNKLLLLCISPASVSTIAEITDPSEVERLTALCQGGHASAASFRNVLQQFAKPQRGFSYTVQHGEEPDFDQLEALARHTQESHA